MLDPFHEQLVSGQNSEVQFSGFDLEPGRQVRITAFRPYTGTFETVASTRGGTSAFPISQWGGTKLYSWSTSGVRIGGQYWEQGARGAKARIRPQVKVGANWQNMVTVEEDWGECYATVDSPGEFQQECSAEESPDAHIYTSDYCVDRSGDYPQVRGLDYLNQSVHNGIVTGVSMRAQMTFDIPRSRVRGFEVDIKPVGSLRGTSCRLEGSSQTTIVCTCTDDCGDFGDEIALDAFEEPVRFEWALETSADVPTNCGLTEANSAIGFDDLNVTTTGTPLSQDICEREPVPDGWIITDDVDRVCFNEREITYYEGMPRNSVLEICHYEPIPSGWIKVGEEVDRQTCLDDRPVDSDGTLLPNVFRIARRF